MVPIDKLLCFKCEDSPQRPLSTVLSRGNYTYQPLFYVSIFTHKNGL